MTAPVRIMDQTCRRTLCRYGVEEGLINLIFRDFHAHRVSHDLPGAEAIFRRPGALCETYSHLVPLTKGVVSAESELSMDRDLNMRTSLVRAHLALGSRGCAEDRATLLDYEIGAILSLTATAPGLQIPHHTVEIQDRHPLPSGVIRECVDFIDYHEHQGNRVLLHCEMGISRSPAICACFLYEREGISLEEAHYRTKVRHPIADPHPVLLASIEEYYKGRLLARLDSSFGNLS